MQQAHPSHIDTQWPSFWLKFFSREFFWLLHILIMLINMIHQTTHKNSKRINWMTKMTIPRDFVRILRLTGKFDHKWEEKKISITAVNDARKSLATSKFQACHKNKLKVYTIQYCHVAYLNCSFICWFRQMVYLFFMNQIDGFGISVIKLK